MAPSAAAVSFAIIQSSNAARRDELSAPHQDCWQRTNTVYFPCDDVVDVRRWAAQFERNFCHRENLVCSHDKALLSGSADPLSTKRLSRALRDAGLAKLTGRHYSSTWIIRSSMTNFASPTIARPALLSS
jgi:hypothetical protein